jgi:sucrose-6-phosphate hydrolase SacC (GH32 family)
VDRSLVEAFFNEEKSISIRSYSDYDAQGISLFAEGDVVVRELHVVRMESIY